MPVQFRVCRVTDPVCIAPAKDRAAVGSGRWPSFCSIKLLCPGSVRPIRVWQESRSRSSPSPGRCHRLLTRSVGIPLPLREIIAGSSLSEPGQPWHCEGSITYARGITPAAVAAVLALACRTLALRPSDCSCPSESYGIWPPPRPGVITISCMGAAHLGTTETLLAGSRVCKVPPLSGGAVLPPSRMRRGALDRRAGFVTAGTWHDRETPTCVPCTVAQRLFNHRSRALTGCICYKHRRRLGLP